MKQGFEIEPFAANVDPKMPLQWGALRAVERNGDIQKYCDTCIEDAQADGSEIIGLIQPQEHDTPVICDRCGLDYDLNAETAA